MSTLRVTNVQDTSGGNSLTTAQIYNGAAKAWVNFNGQGVVAIRSSFNVSTITDNATGDFTTTFSTAFSDANYCTVASCSTSGGTYLEFAVNLYDQPNGSFVAPTTTAFRATYYGQGAFRDPNHVMHAVFR